MAEIILFPAQIRTSPANELDRTLTRLRAALAEQSAAITAWRGQLERLRLGLGALGRSLESQNAQLGAAEQDVTELHAQARRLEAWADGVLSR